MRCRALLLLALAAPLLATCGNEADRTPAAAQPAPARQAAPCTPGTTQVDGASLVMPTGARAGRTPLVMVVIPGGRGDARDRLGVRAAATRTGAAVLYPTVAAGLKALDPCPDSARVSVLELHGGADTVVPFRGAKPDRKGNVLAWATGWARRDGCGARAAVAQPGRLVTRYRFARCRAGRRIEVRLLHGTDHGWPGSGPPFPSRNPSGVDATPLVVDFLLGA